MTAKATKNLPLDILLVEDNEADVKITLRTFEGGVFKNNIYVVYDGQECLDFIHHAGIYQDKQKYPRPDLILLDINLPKLDGFGVIKAIREDKEYNFIPIVVLTGSKNQEDVTKSYRFGANSFIQKPLEPDLFIKMVEGFNFYWHVVNRLPGRKI